MLTSNNKISFVYPLTAQSGFINLNLSLRAMLFEGAGNAACAPYIVLNHKKAALQGELTSAALVMV